ncbi:MAG: RNA methyltransferase [Terracidiphilus sp.]|nr:RNA methyltransferase [Terracidiphilus sp.]
MKELRRALAHPVREGGSTAGIEGPNLLEEALRAGLRVECVFVAQDAEELLEGLKLPPETEILLLPKELLDSALTTEAPQAIAALVETPDWTWEQLLGGRPRKTAPLVVVLAGVQDPGNLGTILRSAEAFGADGVLSLPGTVSAWNPKAVRASAGSVFRIPLVTASAEEGLVRLRAAGVTIWTTAVQGAEAAHEANLAGPVALLIGNEGNGVAEDVAAQADGALTIPCPGPVESLNAAVAASVLLYEASRQRAVLSHPSQKARRMGNPGSVGVRDSGPVEVGHTDTLIGGRR